MKLFKLVLINLYFLIVVDCKSKYYDGPDREYKFGYTIEGNQHRQEQKDANGIIMGEFGFITADGVYHVTGYGTDENGNFKILYMKNIKVGLPGEPGSKIPPTNLGATTSTTPSTIQRSEPEKNKIDVNINRRPASDITSCSNCIIPKIEETKKQIRPLAPASVTINVVDSKQQNKYNNDKVQDAQNSRSPNNPTSNSIIPNNIGILSKQQNKADSNNKITSKQIGNAPSKPNYSLSQNDDDVIQTDSDFNVDVRNDEPEDFSNNKPNSRTENKITELPNKKATQNLDSKAGNKISKIDSKINLKQKPKSQDEGKINSRTDILQEPISGISPPLSGNTTRSQSSVGKSSSGFDEMTKFMTGLLYKFNYTVGYHGHNEQGDAAGAKDGGYYFIGRDGFKRIVNYTANEFGYQPYIKLETAAPEDIPIEETEKEAGLKGYEFKWFNLDDKNRKRK